MRLGERAGLRAEFVERFLVDVRVLRVHVLHVLGELLQEADVIDAQADQVRRVVVDADAAADVFDELPHRLRRADRLAKYGEPARPAFDGERRARLGAGVGDRGVAFDRQLVVLGALRRRRRPG